MDQGERFESYVFLTVHEFDALVRHALRRGLHMRVAVPA